jgi:hypothetical protein
MYARITDDTRGTIFVNEVQSKPISPGHDYGRSTPNRNTSRSGSRQYAAFPCEPVSMSSWFQQRSSSDIYEEPGLQESNTYSTPYC